MNFMEFMRKFHSIILNDLPGEDAHSALSPGKRVKASDALELELDYRDSAVAVILYPEGNLIHCILTKRSSYDGIHSGQVSFPGGKKEHDDPDLEHTARRESLEEISLPFEAGVKIGDLSPIYIPVSEFLVHPILFYLESLPILVPNEREVASIFSFPIIDLLDETRLLKTDIKFGDGLVRKNIPYFNINNHVVWGATAMILAEMKAIIKLMV